MLSAMIEALAWLGTLVLVLRGLPQAYKSWSRGNSFGLSRHMLWLWFTGSLMILPYTISNADVPVTIIYLSNVLFVGIMLWYKYFPKESHVNDQGKKEENQPRKT